MDISKFFDVILAWINVHNHKEDKEQSVCNLPVVEEQTQKEEQMGIDCEVPKELQEEYGETEGPVWNFPTDDNSLVDKQNLEDVETEYRMTNCKNTARTFKQDNAMGNYTADTTSSLLENKPLVKLFSECTDLLKELDLLSKDFKSDREQFLLEMVKDKIVSALLLSGGKAIDDDMYFDIVRHIALNKNDAKEGAEIQDIVSSGVMLEDRVFVRAKVNLK